MSFLDKLKAKAEKEQPAREKTKKEEKRDKKSSSFLQLDVDILQTSTDIIIIAPIPGVEVKNLDISIESENDVVTIQGKREMPPIPAKEEEGEEEKYLHQECQWGSFYRQIILPQKIDVSKVQAKFKKGILILRLPLLGS